MQLTTIPRLRTTKLAEPLPTSGRALTKALVNEIRRRLEDSQQRAHEFSKPKDFRDRDTRGLVLRVEPGGTMTWFVEYRCVGTVMRGKDAGNTKKRTTRYPLGNVSHVTLEMARDAAGDYRRAVGKGTDRTADPNYRDRLGLARAAELPTLASFLDADYRRKRYEKAQLKAGKDEYDLERLKERADDDIARVRSLFADFLSHQLDAIAKPAIEEWRTQRVNSGKQAGTVNRDIAVLRGVLSLATEKFPDRLPGNPLRTLKDFSLHNERPRRLTADEYQRLICAVDMHEQWRIQNTSVPLNAWLKVGDYDASKLRNLFEEYADWAKPMILLSLNTGVRRGNLIHLRWGEVDFAHRPRPLLYLRASATKGGKRHELPLNDTATQVLTTWRNQQEKSALQAKAFVFPSRAGTALDGDNVGRTWRRIVEAAHIESCRWHDLRHDFASNIVSKTKSLYIAQQLLGHGDARMTQRYAHLAREELDAAVGMLDER